MLFVSATLRRVFPTENKFCEICEIAHKTLAIAAEI